MKVIKFYTFYHKLYGEAILLPNSKFEVSDNPKSVCYRLVDAVNENEIRDSSIADISHTFPHFILKRMGY